MGSRTMPARGALAICSRHSGQPVSSQAAGATPGSLARLIEPRIVEGADLQPSVADQAKIIGTALGETTLARDRALVTERDGS